MKFPVHRPAAICAQSHGSKCCAHYAAPGGSLPILSVSLSSSLSLPPAPHLPGKFLLLGPHRDDHHLEWGQPQWPGWERRKGKLLILALTVSVAAASRLKQEMKTVENRCPKPVVYLWHPYPPYSYSLVTRLLLLDQIIVPTSTLTAVAQWIEHQPENRKVAGLIPSNLDCGPGP